MTTQRSQAAWVAALPTLALSFLLGTGVSLLNAAAIIGVLAIQAWGGWAIWRAMRSDGSIVELVGMSLAIGTAASALSAIAVRAIFDTTLGWTLPAIVGLGLVVFRRGVRGAPRVIALPVDRGVAYATVGGLVVGIAGLLLVSVRSYPLSWRGTWGGYHGDMLFFEAIGSSLASWGPLDSIFSPDMALRYHWLVYGWTGFLSEATGAEPFVALTRVVPILTLISMTMIAASWTRRLTSASWAPLLAVALIVTGGYVGASYGTILNFDSPSTTLTTVWLMAGVLITWQRLTNGIPSRSSTLLVLALLSTASTAGKVSTGFLFVATLSVVAGIAMMRRATWRSDALFAFAISAVSALATYLVVIAGSADPGGLGLLSWIDRASSVQGLNPVPGYAGAALGTLILALGVASRWAGALWFWRDPVSRWSPSAATAAGLALGGILPLILVSGGVNETWFALAASAPLSVFSAAGVGRFITSLRSGQATSLRTRLTVTVGSAALIWIVLWVLWNTGPSGGNTWEYTLRWSGSIVALISAMTVAFFLKRSVTVPGAMLGFTILIVVLVAVPGRLLALGPSPTGTQPGTRGDLFGSTATFAEGRDQSFVVEWSNAEAQAGAWLRGVGDPETLVATNHTFSPLVSALSGKQTYVSAMHYQAPYGWPGNVPVLVERERVSWDFIDDPSDGNWLPLCEAGVTHLWIDPRRTSVTSWLPWGEVALATPEVVLVVMTTQAREHCR